MSAPDPLDGLTRDQVRALLMASLNVVAVVSPDAYRRALAGTSRSRPLITSDTLAQLVRATDAILPGATSRVQREVEQERTRERAERRRRRDELREQQTREAITW